MIFLRADDETDDRIDMGRSSRMLLGQCDEREADGLAFFLALGEEEALLMVGLLFYLIVGKYGSVGI